MSAPLLVLEGKEVESEDYAVVFPLVGGKVNAFYDARPAVLQCESTDIVV